eukprot:3039414-Pyramimonas_sp.AAC.1
MEEAGAGEGEGAEPVEDGRVVTPPPSDSGSDVSEGELARLDNELITARKLLEEESVFIKNIIAGHSVPSLHRPPRARWRRARPMRWRRCGAAESPQCWPPPRGPSGSCPPVKTAAPAWTCRSRSLR